MLGWARADRHHLEQCVSVIGILEQFGLQQLLLQCAISVSPAAMCIVTKAALLYLTVLCAIPQARHPSASAFKQKL